jgi:drug/metabolite transporter (DMT)-like permease
LAYLLLLFVTFIWAGNFPAAKYALAVVDPLVLIALRTLVGALLLLVLGRNSTPAWGAALREDPRSTFILALTGVVSSGLLFYWGLRLTTASNAGIISASTPIWVTMLSWIFVSERFGLINICGVLLSFSGLVAIICQGSLTALFSRSFNLGDLLILTGQLNWAAYTVYGRIVLARRSAIAATASAYVVGAVLLSPLLFLDSPIALVQRLSLLDVAAVIYLSVLSPLSNFWYSKALAKVSPHRAAIFMNLMPIIVLVFSAFVLGERISAVQMIGTAVVIGGVILTTRF